MRIRNMLPSIDVGMAKYDLRRGTAEHFFILDLNKSYAKECVHFGKHM